MKTAFLFLPAAALILPGCGVRTVAHVATAPVRVASKGADWATTSRDESDRNRGRQIRRQAESDRKACKKAGYDARECNARYDID